MTDEDLVLALRSRMRHIAKGNGVMPDPERDPWAYIIAPAVRARRLALEVAIGLFPAGSDARKVLVQLSHLEHINEDYERDAELWGHIEDAAREAREECEEYI